MVAVISCSEDNEPLNESTNIGSLTKNNNNEYVFTQKDSMDVVENAKLDMISFVTSIRGFYTEGDSYEDLKLTLDSENQLENMDPVVRELLFKAYEHISNNTNDDELDGIEMLNVATVLMQNAQNDGLEDINQINLETYSLQLWGSDLGNLAKSGCRWWALGCHLSNFWSWLNNDAGGGSGGQSNLQAISTALTAVATIVGAIILFSGD
jgi:hypothetical protein